MERQSIVDFLFFGGGDAQLVPTTDDVDYNWRKSDVAQMSRC